MVMVVNGMMVMYDECEVTVNAAVMLSERFVSEIH
jgi:hypothetical protein